MRKLIIAAVAAAALAAPSGASASTGASAETCVTPVIHCVLEAYRESVYPIVDCVLHVCGVPRIDADPACYLLFGQPCTRRQEA